jgi:hypothetical protein
MFTKVKNWIREKFKVLSKWLKSKLGEPVYNFIHPYLDLLKRLAIGALDGMEQEYLLWKEERYFSDV